MLALPFAALAVAQVLAWPIALAGAVALVVLPGLVRRERRQRSRLKEMAAALDHERERAARMPVAEERARAAAEVHDAVAGSLSGIAVRAGDAEAALDKDPALARTSLRAIRRSADEALSEMRRLLDALPVDEADAEPEPPMGLAELPSLVERARAAGMPVTLHVDGTPQPVPASLDRSAYRIVHEALTNAHRHAAGAPASVRVVWRRTVLGLQVRDTGNGRPAHVNGDGQGLAGIRERARLHGGELRAGTLPGGGFEVTARLPL